MSSLNDPNDFDFTVTDKADAVALSGDTRYNLSEAASNEEVATVTTTTVVAAADDSKKPYGDVTYADPGYQEDGVKRYPLDDEKHIRAAWSYINMPKNAKKYSASDLRRVRARIIAAMRSLGVDVTDQAVASVITAAGKKAAVVDEEEYAAEIMSPQVMPMKSAPWHGVLTMEGVESGDARMFGPGGLTWDEPPLPLMWQKETSHGGEHNVSVRVGSIEQIWREPAGDGNTGVNRIMGRGTLDLGNPDGSEVFRRMREGHLRGNSVDVDSVKSSNVELRFDTPDDDDESGLSVLFAQPDLTVYKKGRIRASTIVEIPAFTEARLSLVDVPDNALPFDETDTIDAEVAELVAAASVIEVTDAPPREWFNEPTDVPVDGALTITPEGRIYGYVAPAGVRHRSFPDRDQYVPLGNVDYSRFMSGQTIVADGGRVATGAITMNCGHASTTRSLTAVQASDHYDNSCSIVATARVGENEHGVWIAGALIGDLTPATLQRVMACKLSGDWRAHLDRPGWREFVAALLVPVPGFPMVRRSASLQIDEGQLVASSVPVLLAMDEQTDVVEVSETTQPDVELIEARASRVATLGRKVRVARLRASMMDVKKKKREC